MIASCRVRAHRGMAAEDCLLKWVHDSTAGAVQSDDLTILTLRYDGPQLVAGLADDNEIARDDHRRLFVLRLRRSTAARPPSSRFSPQSGSPGGRSPANPGQAGRSGPFCGCARSAPSLTRANAQWSRLISAVQDGVASGYSRSNFGSPCRMARSGSRRAQSPSRRPLSQARLSALNASILLFIAQ
jgi:hypothetical protein